MNSISYHLNVRQISLTINLPSPQEVAKNSGHDRTEREAEKEANYSALISLLAGGVLFDSCGCAPNHSSSAFTSTTLCWPVGPPPSLLSIIVSGFVLLKRFQSSSRMSKKKGRAAAFAFCSYNGICLPV